MLTWDELHTALADVLGEPAERAQPHRARDGLDPADAADRWLRRRGIEVRFAELAERPTLAEWWELLAEKGQVETAAGPPVVEPADIEPEDPFVLALMQHAYWIGRDSGQSLGSVAAHLYVELDGRAIDPARFEEAVRGLVRRHPMLRVAVSDDGTQRILPERPGPVVTVHDLRSGNSEAELARIRPRCRSSGSRSRTAASSTPASACCRTAPPASTWTSTWSRPTR